MFYEPASVQLTETTAEAVDKSISLCLQIYPNRLMKSWKTEVNGIKHYLMRLSQISCKNQRFS
jgi:hypothetical protein